MASSKLKLVQLPSFYRDNTPLMVFPITVNGEAAILTGWSAYLTLTLNDNPSSNSDAFFHKLINTDATGSLVNPTTGQSFGPNFNYQFTESDTSGLDPEQQYNWDLKVVGPNPTDQLFTLLSGKFQPWKNFGRGLS